MENLQGTVLKGYKLEERIGAGGFGAVYRARQTTLGREVAVKIILPAFANNPDFIRRFESEANLVARLEHPHITPLYDFWRDPSGAYLVMRYLRGGSVRQSLQNGPYELDALSQLLDQISSALDFAHRHDVIHRDIKPGNILLDEDGHAYLADFGIAKDVTGADEHKTAADAVVGSLDYISPEQARSEPVTPRTDIYSMGVSLYEMITNEHPFKNASTIERLFKHINDPLPPILNLTDGMQEAVNEILQKATAKNPDDRYQDVLSLAIDFRRAIGREAEQGHESIVEQLTMREQEILFMIAGGKSNREIADELVVTVGTVKWHITQLYKKLGVRSRVQAIVRARELNLIVSGDTVDILPDLERSQTSLSLPEPENPYKGLHAFHMTDARDFFGRDDLTKKLLERLDDDDPYHRFLAVVGPSGSGKSSLVRAGFLPALWKGAIPGSEKWFVVDMIPGTHPMDKLEAALIRVAANQAANLREQLQRDERGLLRVADIILPGDGTELVIVVDQFEEVFTLVEKEEDRQQFLDLLRAAVSEVRSRVRVVVTLRADYYDRPLQYPEFGELIRVRMETVLPLSAKGLERAIRGPAERVGVTFEQGLVEQIVASMNYQAGALPLLQYALTELFDRRSGRFLTQDAYVQIGGAVGALANRADEIFGTLTSEAQRLTHQLLMRLVTLGEGAEDARRRATYAELLSLTEDNDLMEEVIDQFAAYRLLSLDHDPQTRQPTVEVAHEAILREWDRLRQWLNESRDDIRRQRVLTAAAAQWTNAGQDDSYLLHGNRLTESAAWVESTISTADAIALTKREHLFLEASLAAHEQRQAEEGARQQRELETARQLAATEHARAEEQAQSARTLRRRAAFLAAISVIAALLALAAFFFARQSGQNAILAQDNADLALARQVQAQAETLQRATAQAQAESERERADEQRDAAFAAEAQAESQAAFRATAEAIAIDERETAEQQARLATSRELSLAALTNLESDPELSLLLAMQALDTSHTKEAEEALHQGLQSSRVLMTLSDHTGRVGDSVYSPDGSTIATASDDDTVKVWEVTSGQLLNTLPYRGIDDLRGTLMFDDSGEKLAMVAAGDNYESAILHIWNVDSGELLNHKEVPFLLEIWSLALSPDWKSVVAGGDNGTVGLWDVETADKIVSFSGHESIVQGIAFNPDGTRLAITSRDGQVTIWSVAATLAAPESQPILAFETPNDTRLVNARFSNDSTRLALGFTDNDVELWNLADTTQPQFILSGHINWTANFAFHPDDTVLATGGGDSTAIVWDLNTGERLFTLSGHKGFIRDLNYSPDGSRLITAGADGTARIWNAQPFADGEVLTFAVAPAIMELELSPDEQKFALGSNGGGPATIWDAATGKQLLSLQGEPGTSIYRVSFNPDGSRIATVGEDGMVRVWDSETGDILLAFSGHTDGLAGGFYQGTVDVSYSPDGSRLATAGADGVAKVWDAETGQELLVLAGHSDSLHSLAYSPDGRYIATSSDSGDTTVKVWDADSGAEIYSLGPNPGRAWGLSFSPDSSQLGAGGQGGFIKVWDLASGDELSNMAGQSVTIGTVTFSPDGKQLITGGGDSASIWDIETGTELLNLAPTDNWKVALSGDGRRLYAATNLRPVVRVYALPSEDAIALARSKITRPLTSAECLQYLHLSQCPADSN